MTCVGSQRYSKKNPLCLGIPHDFMPLGFPNQHCAPIISLASVCSTILTFMLTSADIYELAWLTLRRLMSYIYMEHPFLMFLDHTQRRTTVGRTPLDE